MGYSWAVVVRFANKNTNSHAHPDPDPRPRPRYGSGDLGDRGMALFFATHQCNGVCQYMGLEPFPLAPSQCIRITEKVVSTSSGALEEKVGTVMAKLGSLAEAKVI